MNIWGLSAVASGFDTLELIGGDVDLRGVIGLTANSHSSHLSGYVDGRSWCQEREIDFVPVESYSLTSATDEAVLMDLPIDLLLVTGWQRLVPNWLLKRCRIGAVGVHGSPMGIRRGRGRSPQNWALLLGATRFSIAIFWLDEGIDSGSVIRETDFPLGPEDDIRTSYMKASLASAPRPLAR